MQPMLTSDNGAALGTGPALVNQAGSATVLLLDNFSGSNGTNLTAHTMNTGPGWTTGQNGFTLDGSGHTVATTASADCWDLSDSGQSSVTATLTVNAGSSSGGLVIRAQDANNFWLAELVGTGQNLLKIYEIAAGSFTVRASTSQDATVARVVMFQGSGTTLTTSVQGGANVGYTSSDFQTATKCGVHAFGTVPLLSSFQVTNP